MDEGGLESDVTGRGSVIMGCSPLDCCLLSGSIQFSNSRTQYPDRFGYVASQMPGQFVTQRVESSINGWHYESVEDQRLSLLDKKDNNVLSKAAYKLIGSGAVVRWCTVVIEVLCCADCRLVVEVPRVTYRAERHWASHAETLPLVFRRNHAKYRLGLISRLPRVDCGSARRSNTTPSAISPFCLRNLSSQRMLASVAWMFGCVAQNALIAQ